MKINENIYNTHDLRMKINEMLEKPEDDDTPWVPFSKILDSEALGSQELAAHLSIWSLATGHREVLL